MFISIPRMMLSIATASAVAVVAAAPSGAQAPLPTRAPLPAQAAIRSPWQAWIGCWTTAPSDALIAAPVNAPMVCVTPASDLGPDAVDLTTIAGGKVVSADRIDASGKEWAFDQKGCKGVQQASRSSDGRRVYLKSTSSCNGIPTSTSAVLSMTSSGEWLDVRSVTAGGGENVRTARYHEVAGQFALPKDIADAIAMYSRGEMQSARVAAGANIGENAVIEASHHADAAVVEAWLFERGQKFSTLDARDLLGLADAGVPSRVTDAMIAVSNPSEFAFGRGEDARSPMSADTTVRGQRVYVTMDYDPWSYGYYGYDRYGSLYNNYGLGYGSGYGYGYGYGSGYGGYGAGYLSGYAPPIVIVNGPATVPHGTLVKGRGYTQGGSSASGRSGSSSGASSSSAPSSSAPQQAPAPQPAQTETRTAHPRP